jgi:hypothetical protein
VVVIGGEFYNETEVGLDHELACGGVATTDPLSEGDLFGTIEEGSFADALEVGLESSGKFDIRIGKLGFSGRYGFCFHTRLDRRECGTFGLIFRGQFSSRSGEYTERKAI